MLNHRLKDKKIVVIGLGSSGEKAALLAKSKFADVFVTEQANSKGLQAKADFLKKHKINVELGKHSTSFLEEAEFIITSPGVKNDALPLRWARNHKVEIISEIEFASWFCPVPVIAITGTNGKTTTTTLIGRILKHCGKRTVVCGNIGNPFSGEVAHLNHAGIVVLEVSSFQLQHINSFHPKVSIILNISQNHFDHHYDFKEYFNAKAKIFSQQNADDYVVLNFDDKKLRNLSKKTKAKVMFFSKEKNNFSKYSHNYYGACWIEGKDIVLKAGEKKQIFLKTEKLQLKGEHNLENIMAAILATAALRMDKNKVVQAITRFKGLEHRCEFVAKINGINFVNDSKSTSVDATGKALLMYPDRSVVLICGGRDKGSDFNCMRPLIKKKISLLIVIGEAKDKIKKSIGDFCSTITAQSLKAAVQIAFKEAKTAKTILLSPMCASFDMFRNYEERGEIFKKIVYSLEKK